MGLLDPKYERVMAAIARAIFDASKGVPKELIGDRFVVLGNQRHDCAIYADAVFRVQDKSK